MFSSGLLKPVSPPNREPPQKKRKAPEVPELCPVYLWLKKTKQSSQGDLQLWTRRANSRLCLYFCFNSMCNINKHPHFQKLKETLDYFYSPNGNTRLSIRWSITDCTCEVMNSGFAMWWSFLSSPEICSDRGKKDKLTLQSIQREKPSWAEIDADGIRKEGGKESQVNHFADRHRSKISLGFKQVSTSWEWREGSQTEAFPALEKVCFNPGSSFHLSTSRESC